MSETHIHIISFDIPYPPNYGGVIDVYYKLKALHDAGVKIHLHCFQYHRDSSPNLNSLCEEVLYYPRKTGIFSAITLKPYIVQSRRCKKLLERLQQDDYPILFEGLHTCYYLKNKKLRNRFKIYRESNIEHHYYFHLSRAEKNIFKRIFFFISSLKLKLFQTNLAFASLMLTVSEEDTHYLAHRFPAVRVKYLPSFHYNELVQSPTGKGSYVLYQGNLSVGENYKAAGFLLREVISGLDIRFVIAGMNPPEHLKQLIRKYPNAEVIANPDDETLFRLIRDAQVNIMVTFQPTGLKLKLLNALYNGRFCLVNPEMIAGTEIGELCETASNSEGLRRKLEDLMKKDFTPEMIRHRQQVLDKWHSNKKNCKTLLDFLSMSGKVSATYSSDPE
ncbi:MAG: glycosyltransferase [Bacteroidota bacterium]|nr:glycosyltransferase [Bacteroidota bacterium]